MSLSQVTEVELLIILYTETSSVQRKRLIVNDKPYICYYTNGLVHER